MSLKHWPLSDKTQRKLLELFVLEMTARAAADLLGLQANTSGLFIPKIISSLRKNWSASPPEVARETEVDESNLGGVRQGANGA